MQPTSDQGTDADVSPTLARQLASLVPPGVSSAVKRIAEGDEAFAPVDVSGKPMRGILQVRRASGAGRRLLAGMLPEIGCKRLDVPRGAGGLPQWPAGVVGAIAHDTHYACAMVGREAHYKGVGLDIEPAIPLDADLVPVVGTAAEHAAFVGEPCGARMIFVIKESVFKATFPREGVFLDFPDIRLDLAAGIAHVAGGRVVHWRAFGAPRIVAVAWW